MTNIGFALALIAWMLLLAFWTWAEGFVHDHRAQQNRDLPMVPMQPGGVTLARKDDERA